MSTPKVHVIPVKKKYNGAIRTAIYCRISSHKKAQIESLSAQLSGLTLQIATLPTHVLHDTYIDIASGASLSGRPGFRRLLDDCASGKIQYVITKSISRFSRDVVVALTAINQLHASGAKVYFEEEGIMSDDPNLQVQLAAFLAVAEMENMDRSDNIKWGIQSRAESGKSKTYNRICYGYKHDKFGNLVIKEDEAKIIRFIFRFYLDGYSVLGIIEQLKLYKVKSPSNKNVWNKRAIEKILENVKYAGDAMIKTPNGSYLYSDHHPAIIARDTFDAVQAQKKFRSNITENPDGTVSRKNTKYSVKRVVQKTVDIDELLYDVENPPNG